MRTIYLSVLALFTVIFSMTPGQAMAQDDRIGLSTDGVSFKNALTEPLFDPSIRWVPGDVRTATFFVRNRATSEGSVDLTIRRVLRDDLIRTNFLSVSAQAGIGELTIVTNGGTADLLDDVRIEAGHTIPVRVQVRLLEDAPNSTMVLGTDLQLKVKMHDARAIAPITPDGTNSWTDQGEVAASNGFSEPRGPLGILPDTGNPLTWWTIPLALLLIIAGAFLALRRRTEPEEDRS